MNDQIRFLCAELRLSESSVYKLDTELRDYNDRENRALDKINEEVDTAKSELESAVKLLKERIEHLKQDDRWKEVQKAQQIAKENKVDLDFKHGSLLTTLQNELGTLQRAGNSEIQECEKYLQNRKTEQNRVIASIWTTRTVEYLEHEKRRRAKALKSASSRIPVQSSATSQPLSGATGISPDEVYENSTEEEEDDEQTLSKSPLPLDSGKGTRTPSPDDLIGELRAANKITSERLEKQIQHFQEALIEKGEEYRRVEDIFRFETQNLEGLQQATAVWGQYQQLSEIVDDLREQYQTFYPDKLLPLEVVLITRTPDLENCILDPKPEPVPKPKPKPKIEPSNEGDTNTGNNMTDETYRSAFAMKDLPKFSGEKGNDPQCHLFDFADFMLVICKIDTDNPSIEQSVDVINRFAASLKNKARQWFGFTYDKLTTVEKTPEKWKEIVKAFLLEFSLIGATLEEREAAVRKLKWDPAKQAFDSFLFEFRVLMKAIQCEPSRQLALFVMAMPMSMYSVLNTATEVEQAIQSAKRAIGIGLVAPMDTTLLSKSAETPKQPETKTPTATDTPVPSVPFMVMASPTPKLPSGQTSLETLAGSIEGLHFRMDQNYRPFRGRNSGYRGQNRRWNNQKSGGWRGGRSGRNFGRKPYYQRGGQGSSGRGQGQYQRQDGQNQNQRPGGRGQRQEDGEGCGFCHRRSHSIHQCYNLEQALKDKGCNTFRSGFVPRGRQKPSPQASGSIAANQSACQTVTEVTPEMQTLMEQYFKANSASN